MAEFTQSLNTPEMEKQITIKEAKSKFSRCREVYKILIGDTEHQVWDIDGYEHDYGKWNNEPPTYWIEMEGGILDPFIRNGVHRICWEINFKQSNYTKHKWGSTDIRSSGKCVIKANGREIYSFGASEMGFAMSKAQYFETLISEHPYNFFEPEKEKGRRIWYYNLPATIEPSYNPGEIRIRPDYIGEFKGKKNQWKWWKEYYERSRYKGFGDTETHDEEHLEESREIGWFNHGDALWDGNIRWFRDAEETKEGPKSLPVAG